MVPSSGETTFSRRKVVHSTTDTDTEPHHSEKMKIQLVSEITKNEKCHMHMHITRVPEKMKEKSRNSRTGFPLDSSSDDRVELPPARVDIFPFFQIHNFRWFSRLIHCIKINRLFDFSPHPMIFLIDDSEIAPWDYVVRTLFQMFKNPIGLFLLLHIISMLAYPFWDLLSCLPNIALRTSYFNFYDCVCLR